MVKRILLEVVDIMIKVENVRIVFMVLVYYKKISIDFIKNVDLKDNVFPVRKVRDIIDHKEDSVLVHDCKVKVNFEEKDNSELIIIIKKIVLFRIVVFDFLIDDNNYNF